MPGRLALALLCLALLAGCGGADVPPAPGAQGAPAPGGGVALEVTDGRLGDATTDAPEGGLRQLSPGGRLDVRPRPDGTRRDGVAAGSECAGAELAPTADALAAVSDATLCLVNAKRAAHGLHALTRNGKLAAASTGYAKDLVAHGYFSHTGRNGSTIRTRLDDAGYLVDGAGWVIGENLAWGTGGLGTPAAIVQAWMNSDGHRANILEPRYREIGIGVAAGNPAHDDGAGATYATAFGAIDRPAARPAAGKRASRRRAGKARTSERRHRRRHRGPVAHAAI